MQMTNPRTLTVTLAGLGLAALALTGCSEKYSAERDAKKAGEAICDIRDADNADEARNALDDLNEQLDDLGSKYAMYTAEDRQDIQNNLADLSEHAIQGNELLAQQDLAVLERSVNNISDDTNEVSQAAWDGLLEGLADCTQ
jgi:hypothetical protein